MPSLNNFTEEEDLLRETVLKFSTDVVEPKVREMDEAEKMDPEIIKGLFEQGVRHHRFNAQISCHRLKQHADVSEPDRSRSSWASRHRRITGAQTAASPAPSLSLRVGPHCRQLPIPAAYTRELP